MQDAVAEVLRERESLAHTPRLPLLVSLAAHGAVAALLILAPRLDRDRELERPMQINMRLAPASAPRPAGGKPAAKATRRPATPKATPPTVIPPKPEPETKVKGRVDPVRTAEKSVFGKAPEPATAKSSSRPAATATPAAAGGEDAGEGAGEFAMPGVGSAGVTGLEGGNFPYTTYVDRMTTRIGSGWFRPQVTGELITVVYFVIERNGTIRDARVERSSGNRTFDRAAYRAVLEASPLPPLPMGYAGTHLGVHLTFH